MVGFVAMRLKRPSATGSVLALLCLMYLITYMDRVNTGTAGQEIRRAFGLTNLQLGHILSAWAYPYALFQIFGGWIGDRWGPRRTLFVCGLIWATATILTGLAGGFVSMYFARLLLGVGEGATFPVATRAMQNWTPPTRRAFAQGITHAFARLGNAITPPLVAWLITPVTLTLAGIPLLTLTQSASWRRPFIVLGFASLAWVFVWLWYFRDAPSDHPSVTAAELDTLPNRGRGVDRRKVLVPWRRLWARIWPVTAVYFCYAWTLWLYLNWLPSYFLHEYNLQLSRSALFTAAVFAGGVGGDYLGGIISDRILERTGDLRKARRNMVVMALLASFVFMLPVFLTHNLVLIILSLGAAFFCTELVIGPMWAIPMDIAPKYSGTASGMMNTGSAVAAILSPITFGFIVDRTGNWQLPFMGSLGLLLVGAALAFNMHPERPLDAEDAHIHPVQV
jgi:MFS family permease